MNIRTRLSLGFGMQVALTACLGAVTLLGLSRVAREFTNVAEHVAPVLANARHLSKLVVDMETGQRGFCLTQREEYLEPYNEGWRAFEALLEVEKQLVEGEAAQVATLERIRSLVHEWQDTAAQPEIRMARLVAERDVDAEQLQATLRDEEGKRLIDDFMSISGELEASFITVEDWEVAFALESLQKLMANKEGGQRGFLITGEDSFLEKYTSGGPERLQRHFAGLRALFAGRGAGDAFAEQLDQLELLVQEWIVNVAEPEIAARREMDDHPMTGKDIAALVDAGTGKALLDEIRREFESFIQVEEERAGRDYASTFKTTRTAKSTALTLLCLALGVGIAAAWLTSRSISGPLVRLADGVERVGSGDLGARVPVAGSEELSRLAGSFNAMAENLEQVAGKRAEAEAELRKIAHYDSLTGLPNRALFTTHLRKAVSRAGKRSDRGYAVFFFDFDRFKVINDSLGHRAGDAVLIQIADRLRSELRRGDIATRFGGDEFVVLLNDVSDLDEAEDAAARMIKLFMEPFQIEENEVVSTASIGVVWGGVGYTLADDVLRDADAAMYHAKAAGRAQFCVFDETMHAAAHRRFEVEQALRGADMDREFELLYQPIVELDTLSVVGFEALIRWNHPQLGLVGPDEFISIAEETGVIVSLGAWVLETACAQLVEWQAGLGQERGLYVNVNLSRKQLSHPTLLPLLDHLVDRYEFPEGSLRLEVTESTVMDGRHDMMEVLNSIKERGFPLAMDDFGTGYSSLSCLHTFPLDVLKIDKSFIGSLEANPEFTAIVHGIVTLAHNLGLTVVAEGVENPEQLVQLQVMGCEYVQGFIFSRPVGVSQATKILHEGFPARDAA